MTDDHAACEGERTQCAMCDNPATHKHAVTGEKTCCGHASNDIDAKPIEDGHECDPERTIERFTRDLVCEHWDNPNPPTGDLVPCHDEAEWEITTHDGPTTRAKYCDEHFLERLREVL